MLHYPDYVKIFISLIAIVNPLGTIPIFIGLITGMLDIERHHIINVVATTVALILLVSLFFGEMILQLFGISIHSFRVGGGILLLLMSISMLHAKVSPIAQTRKRPMNPETGSPLRWCHCRYRCWQVRVPSVR